MTIWLWLVWMYYCMHVWLTVYIAKWLIGCLLYSLVFDLLTVFLYNCTPCILCMNIWLYMTAWLASENVWVCYMMNVLLYACITVWLYDYITLWLWYTMQLSKCVTLCITVWKYDSMAKNL